MEDAFVPYLIVTARYDDGETHEDCHFIRDADEFEWLIGKMSSDGTINVEDDEFVEKYQPSRCDETARYIDGCRNYNARIEGEMTRAELIMEGKRVVARKLLADMRAKK